MTSVLLPDGIDAGKLNAYAAERYGVIMAAGQDAFKDSVVRIGHMGWVDYGDIFAWLHAFAGAFVHCGGYLGARNYLEDAAAAYWAALDAGYPA